MPMKMSSSNMNPKEDFLQIYKKGPNTTKSTLVYSVVSDESITERFDLGITYTAVLQHHFLHNNGCNVYTRVANSGHFLNK